MQTELAAVNINVEGLPAAIIVYMDVRQAGDLLAAWNDPETTTLQFQGRPSRKADKPEETYSLGNRRIVLIQVKWPAKVDPAADADALKEAHEVLAASPRKEMAESNDINEELLMAARAAGVILTE